MNFEIGNRVRLIRQPAGVFKSTLKDWKDKEGTIVVNSLTSHGNIGVELDVGNQWTHNLAQALSRNKGIWVTPDMITLVEDGVFNNLIDRKIDYLWRKQKYIASKQLTTSF